jgi:hypothetical protein
VTSHAAANKAFKLHPFSVYTPEKAKYQSYLDVAASGTMLVILPLVNKRTGQGWNKKIV